MLADSRTRYVAIGAHHRVAAIDSIIGEAAAADRAVFRKEGATWTLAYGGKQVVMRDSKGLRDLALLLAAPGRPHAAVDLASGGVRGSSDDSGGLHEQGDLGEMIDRRARESYRRRLAELDEEEAEADERGDVGRSARLAAEREAIVAELSAAYGLAGRPRRTGSPVERARTTVTARIRDSIRHVEAVHPELGNHLRRSVHTGTVCVYEPETSFRWSM